MAVHDAPHPLAGQAVTISAWVEDPAGDGVKPGATYVIKDWWDRQNGPWGQNQRNPACTYYAMRAAANRIPPDDEVLYGRIDGRGYLVHVSEIDW